jgi:hypothetical protein
MEKHISRTDSKLQTNEFNISLRNLWREMATLTRSYLIAKGSSPEISNAVFNHLYIVPQEFASIISVFLGDQIAERFLQYLSIQIVLTKELIDAQFAGDTNLVNEKFRQLYRISDERAKFMASVNPYWDEAIIRNNIHTYIQYTLQDTTSFLAKEYGKSFDIYNILLNHSDSMGDYFVQGLLNYLNSNPQGNPQS